ncbi:MAG TPA: hypothetical protein VFK33_10900 [Bacillales bacterium]|nr:hypothetical protein [Bacillales bacterium]
MKGLSKFTRILQYDNLITKKGEVKMTEAIYAKVMGTTAMDDQAQAAIVSQEGEHSAFMAATDHDGHGLWIQRVSRRPDGGWTADYDAEDMAYDADNADHRHLIELAREEGPTGDEVRQALRVLAKACERPEPVASGNIVWIDGGGR